MFDITVGAVVPRLILVGDTVSGVSKVPISTSESAVIPSGVCLKNLLPVTRTIVP